MFLLGAGLRHRRAAVHLKALEQLLARLLMAIGRSSHLLRSEVLFDTLSLVTLRLRWCKLIARHGTPSLKPDLQVMLANQLKYLALGVRVVSLGLLRHNKE